VPFEVVLGRVLNGIVLVIGELTKKHSAQNYNILYYFKLFYQYSTLLIGIVMILSKSSCLFILSRSHMNQNFYYFACEVCWSI